MELLGGERKRLRVPDLIFVADQVFPVRGMERAVTDLTVTLGADVSTEVVVISGPPSPGLASQRLLGLPIGPFRYFRAAIALRRLLGRVDRSSIVVAVGMWSALPTLMAVGRNPAIRVVVWEHSLLPWRLANVRSLRTLATLVYRCFVRRVSQVVAVSPAVGRTVDEFTGHQVPVVVVPNVVSDLPVRARALEDDDEGEVVATSEDVRLLGVGGLVSVKNWSLAVEAMSYLPNSFRLAIAGEGGQRRKLERQIKDLGLADRVSLLGHRGDVPKLLAKSHVVVHPSFVETFGYSLLEAAAAGLPVVCLDMPVMNEVVPNSVPGLVCGNSAPEFAQAVLKAWQARIAGDFVPKVVQDNSALVRRTWLDLLAHLSA